MKLRTLCILILPQKSCARFVFGFEKLPDFSDPFLIYYSLFDESLFFTCFITVIIIIIFLYFFFYGQFNSITLMVCISFNVSIAFFSTLLVFHSQINLIFLLIYFAIILPFSTPFVAIDKIFFQLIFFRLYDGNRKLTLHQFLKKKYSIQYTIHQLYM